MATITTLLNNRGQTLDLLMDCYSKQCQCTKVFFFFLEGFCYDQAISDCYIEHCRNKA